MIQKKTFYIKTWKNWDDEIDEAVQKFRSSFLLYPNILVANPTTLRRIDIIADKRKLTNSTGSHAEDGQYCSIGQFDAIDYELNFCINDKLPDKCFALVYDSDPDGDGEPVPEEDTDVKCYKEERVA